MSILQYISNVLPISSDRLLAFISSCPHRYKVYKIPKRNGNGIRVIAQPSRELKYIQNLVANKFLRDLPVHSAATAYRTGLSIKDNAAAHVHNRYFLKSDFKDFFPSIKPSDLIAHVQKFKPSEFDDQDRYVLERIFFYKINRIEPACLSIGSPASPLISNTIMFDFDQQLSELCRNRNIVYTRYADDLAFSTNRRNELFELPSRIKGLLDIIVYPKVLVHPDKTVFLSMKGNIHITGLVVTTDGRVSIGRANKRKVKSLIFRHIQGELDASELQFLKGYLAFCNGVEPTFLKSMEAKYGNEAIFTITKGSG